MCVCVWGGAGGVANHLFFPPHSASLCDTRKSDSYHNGGMNHSVIEFRVRNGFSGFKAVAARRCWHRSVIFLLFFFFLTASSQR